jgi:hypothetical protein
MILLGTFVMGLAAARLGLFSECPVAVAFQNIEGPRDVSSCDSPDRITLGIFADGETPNRLESPQLAITNNGSEAIYFYPYDLWVRGQATPFAFPARPKADSQAFQEIEIAPGDSVSLPAGKNAPVEVIFRYRHGEVRSFRTFTAYFKGGTPDGCR